MKYSLFGLRLKQLRNERNVTAQQVADAIGINRVAVTQWEIRGNYPSQEYLLKLADYFDVSIDYLMGRTENKAPVNKYAIDENTLVISERDYSPEQIEAIKAILKIKK